MITRRDQLWKGAFRMLMPQFVQFYFPDHYDEIDWSKGIEYLDKELHTLQIKSESNGRIADVLVKLYLKSGEAIWLLLHIEIQGYVDKDFELRVHQMQYRIEDLFSVNPIMLAILTDDNPNFRPKEYRTEVWGTVSYTAFNSYKVMDHPPSTYKIKDNAVALIMEIVYNSTQLKKLPDDKIMDLFLPIAKKFFIEGYEKEEIKLLISFIEAHVKFENSDYSRIFDENIDNMVKYETTEDILAIFDTEKRLKRLHFLEAQEEKMRASMEQLRMREEEARMKEEESRMREEKSRMREEKSHARTIMFMFSQGIKIDLISRVIGITENEILEIQVKYKDSDFLKDLS
jgi:hypothetical protein